MKPIWTIGDQVRVIRNIRNDGTFPGEETGAHLIRRGSTGFVIDIGTFLQDQIIYSVHFLDQNRIVGCREEELIGADEPWVASRFEFREKVRMTIPLNLNGESLLAEGAVGEILKVVRDGEKGPAYHVHFDSLPGRVLQIPEKLLEALQPVAEEV